MTASGDRVWRGPRKKGDWSKPGIIDRLGEESDHAIAQELGITRQAVALMRKKLGIRCKLERTWELPTEVHALLGQLSDNDLAKSYGVPTRVVAAARKEAGIERYRVPCGNITRYNAGCRCALCRRAQADRMAAYWKKNPGALEANKKRAAKKVLASAPHAIGKIGWYGYGCRCEGCKEAARTYVATPRRPRPAEMPNPVY